MHFREHMFDKQLTLSDVGKLNRLIVPKQHALNYFPHIHHKEGKKDAFLNFEDELGKSWRFRYSYWNSSQSYVLTKGWSRFVREKGLEAGDVVVFERDHIDLERFFVSWRRRNTAAHGGGGAAAQPPMMAVDDSSHPRYFPPTGWHHAGTSSGSNQVAPARTSKRLRLFGVNLSDSPEQ